MSVRICSIISLVRAYGDCRRGRRVLGHDQVRRRRVDRSRRREHETVEPESGELIEEHQRLGHVVVVVRRRIGYGLGHADERTHVDDAVEVRVVIDDLSQDRPVRQIALVEHAITHEGARTRDKGVQDDRFVPLPLER